MHKKLQDMNIWEMLEYNYKEHGRDAAMRIVNIYMADIPLWKLQGEALIKKLDETTLKTERNS